MKPDLMVVLKTTTAEAVNNNPYEVTRKIFQPDPRSVSRLIELLNNLDISGGTGIDYAERKRPQSVTFKKLSDMDITQAEYLAVDFKCNILGGVFLLLLVSYGINLRDVMGRSIVDGTDAEFTKGMYPYPEIIKFFDQPDQVAEEEKQFIESVIYNNTGEFLSIEIEDSLVAVNEQSFKRIAFLKRVFRYIAEQTIKWNRTTLVRDNLVHSPETRSELATHIELLSKRYIES